MKADSGSYRIEVNHVTRVEGHGSIRINVREGVVEEVKLCIVEANRFFESFTRGLSPHEIPWVVGRICGICCVGHQLAALRAVEDSQGIEVSPQTVLLRKMFNESQFLQSHLLHIFFLAVPDFVGAPSVLPLVKSHPEVVKRALRLKKLANDYTAVLGGRAIHPMSATLKGWRQLPTMEQIAGIRDRLLAALPDFRESVAIVGTLKVPAFERETEFVSLKHPDEYALYDGEIFSSDTRSGVPVRDYRSVTNEFTVAHSTSRWSRWHREAYAVGALARVNNNFDQLRPEAREVAGLLGLRVPCFNPYMNTVAQVVELVHCLHNSLAMLERVLEEGLKEEDIQHAPRQGRGFGAVEVPRGILFHEYAFDAEGRCCDANAIIPTSQNVNNIEQDMKAFVPRMLPELTREELTHHMEMLLRAYDPCISCSVHMLEVAFIE
ncbi:MAG: Ni/Fe hydrogenase subunit alpha [Magnetococcales bacterium]|nr:Ni/Fe hydrogenase subunit alpha [Magnetococcales bacterium]MBF0156651.1 Ni/Fe hydrogenase subunit alpha [Magnetococcales bacterium]